MKQNIVQIQVKQGKLCDRPYKQVPRFFTVERKLHEKYYEG